MVIIMKKHIISTAFALALALVVSVIPANASEKEDLTPGVASPTSVSLSDSQNKIISQEALNEYLLSHPEQSVDQVFATNVLLYNRAWFAAMRAVFHDYASHYAGNPALGDVGTYIIDQSDCASYRVGDDSFANVGCEIAATYNALRLINRNISLPMIIRSFERDGYLMLQGDFGSDPYAIGDYFSANGVHFTEYAENSSYNRFNNYVASNSNSYHCYIVSFWTEDALPCSLHTIAFYTSGGKLYTYNRSGGIVQENGTRQWSNLLSIIENSSRFIVGYEVRPRLNLY